jgi:hypothetical protein
MLSLDVRRTYFLRSYQLLVDSIEHYKERTLKVSTYVSRLKRKVNDFGAAQKNE